MKKIYKNDKPISLSSKNIAKRHPNLVRRYANTFRGLNRMSGGISQEQIQKVKDFLTEYAESVDKLKYILLDKLCEHTIDTKLEDLQYDVNLNILKKINKAFIAKPGLYKYDIAGIEHIDPDINFLIYALKLVSSFDSSVKKTQELEDVNSNFVFKKEHIPKELLDTKNKEDFEKVYKEIEVERKQGVKPIPIRTPRQLIPLPRQQPILLPRQLIPLPRQLIPLPRMKELPDKVENKILEDSLELSRKIIVSQKADTKQESSHILWNKLKDYVKKKQYKTKNLQDRIDKYKKISKALNSLNIIYDTCLKREIFNDVNGYTMGKGKDIKLMQNIGSESAVGKIFLTSVKNEQIVSKVMEANTQNKNETKINEWITNNVILKNLSKHFALTYMTTECITNNTDLIKNEKLVNYIELCDGDLNVLMKDIQVIKNLKLMKNIAFQVLIAIATYQNNVGFCHLDTHGGNFLFQKNEKVDDNGYYHYIYNNNNFYIKSCEYNIIIFDFGLSAPINIVNDYVLIEDYMRIFEILKSVIKYYIKDKDKDAIYSPVYNAINSIITALINIRDSFKSKRCNIFQEIINKIISVGDDDQTIYKIIKPAIVLNKTPFIIKKVEEEYLRLNIDNSLGGRLERFKSTHYNNKYVENIEYEKEIKKSKVLKYTKYF